MLDGESADTGSFGCGVLKVDGGDAREEELC